MGQLRVFYKIILLLNFVAGCYFISFSQTYNQKVANYITNVGHPFTFLKRYEQLGLKEVGSKGLDSTFYWLKYLAEQVGYNTIESNFLYNDGVTHTLRNLEFNKKGTTDSCIIICGHYDSKIGPGVNDNGSGDFAIYQIAKLIKSVETKYSLKFLYFTGEEIDYLGSKEFVKLINKDSVKIKFVLNLDQLGGTIGENNSGIKCERDESTSNRYKSDAITQSLAKIYTLYTNLYPFVTQAYASDYLSFRDAGYVITGIYQYSNFPYYHTANDLLKYMDFNSLISVTKGALAFVLHLSEAKIKSKNLNTDELYVYYSNKNLVVFADSDYNLNIYDYLGRAIITQNGKESETNIELPNLPAGIYFAFLKSGNNVVYNKFFVEP